MANWYYGESGQQFGPVDENSIRTAINEGRIAQQTLVWREGMPSWLPLAQVTELTGYPVQASPYIPYAQSVPNSGLAVTSMVCGILGLTTCIVLLGIPAVICGHMAMRQISNSALPMGGRGMALSGLIMGYLQLVCCITIVVAVMVTMMSQH